MSNRSLFIGTLLILAAGAAVWLALRPDRSSTDEDSASALASGADVPPGMRMEEDRAVLEDAPEPVHVLEAGMPAPDFTLESLQGEPFRLSEQRGRVVVLNFWATWCEPCREELPDLVMAQDALGDDGLRVIGVSIDEEGREVVEMFHETFPVDYPLLLDGLEIARLYGAHLVVPTTFVVGRDGHILHRFDGAVTLEELLPVLQSHIQQVE